MGSLSVAGNLGLGIAGDEVFSFSSLFSFGNDFFISVFSRVSRPERIVPLASVVSGLLCGSSAFGISTGVSSRAGSRFVSLRPLRTSGTSGVTSMGASGESETELESGFSVSASAGAAGGSPTLLATRTVSNAERRRALEVDRMGGPFGQGR